MNLHNMQTAGLMRRLLAGLYDWLLVIALMMLLSVPLVATLDDAIGPGNRLYQIGLIVIAATFFTAFWSHGGQTLGMKAWRLRLMGRDEAPVSVARALQRFFYACVSAAPAGLGFFWLLWDKEQLSWHDRWSGTTIKLLPKPGQPNGNS